MSFVPLKMADKVEFSAHMAMTAVELTHSLEVFTAAFGTMFPTQYHHQG